jgi:hypothetical protein
LWLSAGQSDWYSDSEETTYGEKGKQKMKRIMAAVMVVIFAACSSSSSVETEFFNAAISRDSSGDLDKFVQDRDALIGMGQQVCIGSIDGKRWPIGGNPDGMDDVAVAAVRSAAQDFLCK